MRMEDLEKYVVVGRRTVQPAEPQEWGEPAAGTLPPEAESPPEPEELLCARCGEQKASVTLCESCFAEVAEGMSRELAAPEPEQGERAGRKPGILGWIGLLALGLSALGLAAATAVLSLQH